MVSTEFLKEMNQPKQENSSSDSGDDQTDNGADNGAPLTEIFEEHFTKVCKYERSEDTNEKGIAVQIHIRVCKCNSKYDDKSYLLKDKMDYVPSDGKEIHFNPACKWRRHKVFRCGQKIYQLRKYCSKCSEPEQNANTHAMNKISPSY